MRMQNHASSIKPGPTAWHQAVLHYPSVDYCPTAHFNRLAHQWKEYTFGFYSPNLRRSLSLT